MEEITTVEVSLIRKKDAIGNFEVKQKYEEPNPVTKWKKEDLIK